MELEGNDEPMALEPGTVAETIAYSIKRPVLSHF